MKQIFAQIAFLFSISGLLALSADNATGTTVHIVTPAQPAALDHGQLLREEAGHCAQCPLPRHHQKRKNKITSVVLLAEAP